MLKDCINGMSAFMDHKGYKSIEAFRGGCADQFGYVCGWPKEDKMAEKTPILPHFANQNCHQVRPVRKGVPLRRHEGCSLGHDPQDLEQRTDCGQPVPLFSGHLGV